MMTMRAGSRFGAHVICVVIACCALGSFMQTAIAGNLPYRVRTKVEALSRDLANAEKKLEAGKTSQARSYLTSAKAGLESLHKNHAGQFEASHPDIVALEKRIAAVEKRIGGGATGTSGSSSGTDDSGGKATAAPLSSSVTRHLSKIESALSSADKQLAKEDLNAATSAFGEAKRHRANLDAWFAGQFDPSHATIRAIDQRIAAVGAKVEGLSGDAAGVGAVLPGVIDALKDAATRLQTAWKPLNLAMIASPPDVSKVRTHLDGVRDVAPSALEVAKRFREQFPNAARLQRLSDRANEALTHCEAIEYVGGQFNGAVTRQTERALKKVKDAIQMGETVKAQMGGNAQLKGALAMQLDNAAKEAEPWLEAIGLFHPRPHSGAPMVTPKSQAVTVEAEQLAKRVAAMRADAARLRNEEVELVKLTISKARFPKTEYVGGEWDDVAALCGKVYLGQMSDRQLLRVAVRSPWDERTEARWRNERWVVGTYRYVGVWLCSRAPTGNCWVYGMSFRHTKQPEGSWGALEYWGVGTAYPILEDNVDK